MGETHFSRSYSNAYNLIYSSKDYEREVTYCLDLLKRFGVSPKKALEFGAGSGNYTRLLARNGIEVCGIELSEWMYQEALSRPDDRITYHLGDIRNVQVGSQFDTVFALFHVMGYLPTGDDVIEALCNAREHLSPSGVILFDFWYGPAVLAQRPVPRMLEVSDERMGIIRFTKPTLLANRNAVRVEFQLLIHDKQVGNYHREDETHLMKYFFIPELELLLKSSGFRMLASEEWVTGLPLSETSWNGVVAAQKV